MKTVQLPEELHKKIKVMAAQEGLSIPKVIARAIEKEDCRTTLTSGALSPQNAKKEGGTISTSPPQPKKARYGMVDGNWVDFPKLPGPLNVRMSKYPNIDWNGLVKFARRKYEDPIDAILIKLAELDPSRKEEAVDSIRDFPGLKDELSIF